MKKFNNESAIKKFKLIHNNKYDYSKVDYLNCRKKIIIVCKKHGDFLQDPMHHWNGSECPDCSKEERNKKISSNTNDFIVKANKIHNNKYDYSKVEYINNKTKICIGCLYHGEFWQIPNSHLRKQGCPICGSINRKLKKRKGAEEFIKEVSKIHFNYYNYSKLKINTLNDEIIVICPIHNEFNILAKKHLFRKQGCPYCNESHGEKLISFLLKENAISFEKEKRFENCRNKLPLPFDFYLPEYNILIEYDGEQHYELSSYYWEKDLKKRDEIKDDFCNKNNLKLIRIPYWCSKEKIEKIIKEL